MQVQALAKTQHVSFDGSEAGEGLSIFVSQPPTAVGRWRLTVKAITNQNTYTVGELYISPPTATAPAGRTSRMIGGAVVPGVTGWTVECLCLGDGTGAIPNEEMDIFLTSSKCCTAPIGASRVAERYSYLAGSSVAPVNIAMKPGQTITRISLFGLGGGGTAVINSTATITVPAGATVVFEPKAPIPQLASQVLAFTNINWVVEFLESA